MLQVDVVVRWPQRSIPSSNPIASGATNILPKGLCIIPDYPKPDKDSASDVQPLAIKIVPRVHRICQRHGASRRSIPKLGLHPRSAKAPVSVVSNATHRLESKSGSSGSRSDRSDRHPKVANRFANGQDRFPTLVNFQQKASNRDRGNLPRHAKFLINDLIASQMAKFLRAVGKIGDAVVNRYSPNRFASGCMLILKIRHASMKTSHRNLLFGKTWSTN